MAQYSTDPVCIITLDQDYPDFGMVAGDMIWVFCNEALNILIVQLNKASDDSFTTITDGPVLEEVSKSNIENVHHAISTIDNPAWKSFKTFCDLNTPGQLISFTGHYLLMLFPYANINYLAGSSSCGDGTVFCDIGFVGLPQVQTPTTRYSNDGRITVQAVSSYGGVRYSLTNVVFADMINNTGIFSGLSPGDYTVWARDAHNCIAKVTVTITTLPVYNPKFRFEYYDILGRPAKVDICERDYTGSPIAIEGGESPFVLSKPQTNLQNKFEVLRPTFATLTLASKKNYQFISLFTQDDRKYLVKFYKPDLRWSGFITPSVFSENLALPTYYTQVNVVDNIEELSIIPFLDDHGNPFQGNFSLVQIVGFVLNKLNLNINVRFAINMLEQVYDIKPVEAYIDASTFFDFSQNTVWYCDKVLKTILEPFGAFIIQDDGVWNVIRFEEQCAAYDYLEYDTTQTYVGTGTLNKVVEIKDPSLRIDTVFTNIDQANLEINPAYGIMDIKHNLIAKESLLFDYDFNPFNFDGSNFKGWTMDRTHQKNVKLSNEKIVIDNIADQINSALGNNIFLVNFGSFALTLENLDSPEGPFGDPQISGTSGLGGGQYVTLHSNPTPFEYRRDAISFSFDYRINGFGESFLPTFMKLKYRIKLFRTGLGPVLYFNLNTGKFATTEIWNDVFIDNFDEDGNYKVLIGLLDSDIVQDSIQVSFKIGGSSWVDAFSTTEDYTDLTSKIKTIPTVNLPKGSKIKAYGKYNYGGSVGWQEGYFFYNLVPLEDGVFADTIYRITPSDTSFPYVRWELIDYPNPNLINGFLRGFFQKKVFKFYLDNVLLQFKPLYSDPPVLEEIAVINNQNYKENLPVELNAGDLPDGVHIDSGQYIYRNFFRTASGDVTGKWKRNGFTESNTLQKILLKQLMKQYVSPTYKITGDFRGYSDMGFLTILKHTQPAPDVELINPELDGTGIVTDGWQNFGEGINWENNDGKAQVTLADSDGDSQILAQSVPLSFTVGERFAVNLNCVRIPGSTRIDELHIVLLDDEANVVQDILVSAFRSEGSITKKVSFNLTQDCANIGFYMKNVVAGTAAEYQIEYFRLTPLSIVRFYYFNQLDNDVRNIKYQSEVVQIIPMLSLADSTVDDSGDNTGGGGTPGGGSFGGAYSSAYGSSFNSVLS